MIVGGCVCGSCKSCKPEPQTVVDKEKLKYAIELLDHLYIKDVHTQAALEYVLKVLEEIAHD